MCGNAIMPSKIAPNELLPIFTQFIEELEQGQYPPCFPDRTKASQTLVDEICGAPWQTAEERDKAQGLVIRLVRLTWQDEAAADERHNAPVEGWPDAATLSPADAALPRKHTRRQRALTAVQDMERS